MKITKITIKQTISDGEWYIEVQATKNDVGLVATTHIYEGDVLFEKFMNAMKDVIEERLEKV